MGLDLVEFAIAVETAFGITIPDADAATLATPGDVVNYLERRLERADASRCLEQRAFYRVRRAVGEITPLSSRSLTPSTHLDVLIPSLDRQSRWRSLGASLGAPSWPALSHPAWFMNAAPLSALAVGGAIFLAKPGSAGFVLGLSALGLTLFVFFRLGAPIKKEFTGDAATLGTVAMHLARRAPAWLKGDDRTWTRAEIERVVRALMIEELGISSFRWTDRFVKDLGCS
jgi:hypothetical protein